MTSQHFRWPHRTRQQWADANNRDLRRIGSIRSVEPCSHLDQAEEALAAGNFTQAERLIRVPCPKLTEHEWRQRRSQDSAQSFPALRAGNVFNASTLDETRTAKPFHVRTTALRQTSSEPKKPLPKSVPNSASSAMILRSPCRRTARANVSATQGPSSNGAGLRRALAESRETQRQAKPIVIVTTKGKPIRFSVDVATRDDRRARAKLARPTDPKRDR